MLNTAFIVGLAAQAGQIMSFGAQNVFVLRQGISGRHVFVMSAICVFADVILVACGVYGIGTLSKMLPMLLPVIHACALVFLFYYGARCFRNAFRHKELANVAAIHANKRWQAVGLQAAAVSFLNPLVWMDAFAVLGTIAQRFSLLDKPMFFAGAISVSVVWFFVLSYGAKALSHWFLKPSVWKTIDILSGAMMWGIAITMTV